MLLFLLLAVLSPFLLIGLLAYGCITFIDTTPQCLQAAKVHLWQELNWWRYEPVEGWHLHYNIQRIPMAMHLHVMLHNRIIPPTWEEIYADINQWPLLTGTRVRVPGGGVYRLH